MITGKYLIEMGYKPNKLFINIRSFFFKLWNCRIWKLHKWTCNKRKGIKPTKEQFENGIEGFYDYAKMYCEICNFESKLSKKK